MYQDYYWELSNEVLYANLPQRASKLPEVKDLDFWIYLIKNMVGAQSYKYSGGSNAAERPRNMPYVVLGEA